MTVLVTDANDNSPIFEQKIYEFSVSEDAKAGELIGKFEHFETYDDQFHQQDYTQQY